MGVICGDCIGGKQEVNMAKKEAREWLDKENDLIDVFIRITEIVDIEPSIRDSWIRGLTNRKTANALFAKEKDDGKFDNLVKAELKLLDNFINQIDPDPNK